MTSPRTVKNAARGDRSAFEALVRHHQAAVAAIAFGLVREPAGSEDIVQDTFLLAWRKLPQLRDPAAFGPWIRQLARTTGLQHLRAGGRRDRRVTLASELASEAVDPSAPERLLLEAEERAVLDEVFDDIEPADREILVLFHREGRSTRQVAQLLDLSEAAVRKRLSRARARLKEGVEGRFAETVRRTAPTAGLVAVVIAGLVPRRARAGRWAAASAAIAGVAALWMLGTRPDPAPEPEPAPAGVMPVTPAATRRARRPPPDAPAPAKASPPGRTDLQVPVGPSDRVSRTFTVTPSFGVARWFPTPDEVPALPDTSAGRTLQALLDLEADGGFGTDAHAELTEAFLEAAQAEGWTAPLDVDEAGWGVLVALEAHRRTTPRPAAFADLARATLDATPPGLADFGALYALDVLRQDPHPTEADLDRVLALLDDQD
ncbi:MAG: sigma-70 family RNA polymerase sigma factor, partial [Myxococcota bacterium]